MAVSRFIVLAIILILLLILTFYFVKSNKVLSRRVIKNLAISTALLFIGAITSIPRPITWEVRSVCVVSIFYGTYFCYMANKQFVDNVVFYSFIEKHSLKIISFFSLIEFYLIYNERDNLGSFIDHERFNLSIGYYLYTMFMYIIPVIFNVLCVKALYDVFYQSRSTARRIRMIFACLMFSAISLWWFLGLLNFYLFVVIGEVYRYPIEAAIIILRLLAVPIGFPAMLPPAVLSRISHYVDRWLVPYYHRQDYLLHYLHEKGSKLVLCVDRLPKTFLNEQRIITELGDVREAVWSHIPHRWFVSAKREAIWIYKQLISEDVVDRHGSYNTHSAWFNTKRHNLKVARYLHSLDEEQSASLRRVIEY
jgi:hypothetical protein